MDAKVTGPDTIQLQLNDEERGNLENSVITAGFVHELLDSAGVQMGTTITLGLPAALTPPFRNSKQSYLRFGI
jgi:hypothetical protein